MSSAPHPHDGDGPRRARGPFGPLASLDEVQRQAVDAALRITAELTSLSSGLSADPWAVEPAAGVSDAGEPRPAPLDVGRLRSDVARAADTFAELLRAVLDIGFDAMDELARRPQPRLATTVVGGAATLRASIRNGPEAATGVRPHVPQLAAADGRVLAATVRVDPPTLDLAPHERREVEVLVTAPPEAEPGRYHGLLLVAGLPDSAQPIVVEVLGDHG